MIFGIKKENDMEQVKIIEIPNFITIKIVKINEIYSASYVESFSDNHFYRNEFDQMVTHLKFPMPYSLCFKTPKIIENRKLEDLKEKIYKLYKELKDQIPRAEKGQKYYIINRDFTVYNIEDCYHGIDNVQYNSYNYFLSEIQAKKFASKMQEYLMELWKEEMEKK